MWHWVSDWMNGIDWLSHGTPAAASTILLFVASIWPQFLICIFVTFLFHLDIFCTGHFPTDDYSFIHVLHTERRKNKHTPKINSRNVDHFGSKRFVDLTFRWAVCDIYIYIDFRVCLSLSFTVKNHIRFVLNIHAQPTAAFSLCLLFSLFLFASSNPFIDWSVNFQEISQIDRWHSVFSKNVHIFGMRLICNCHYILTFSLHATFRHCRRTDEWDWTEWVGNVVLRSIAT